MDFLNLRNAFPTSSVPEIIRSFGHCLADSTENSDEAAFPVAHAAAAAAVQGVVDVIAPYDQILPCSLFVWIVQGSGRGKSSLLERALAGFEDFEAGSPAEEGHTVGQEAACGRCHPFVIDESTGAGEVDLYRHGAQSLLCATDEGAKFLRQIDLAEKCKRFDGATIRNLTRKHGAIVLPNTRQSVCGLIQDKNFETHMRKKGEIMIESGFLPRTLVAFASAPRTRRTHLSASSSPRGSPKSHPATERIRTLMANYADLLGNRKASRTKLVVKSDAEASWRSFSRDVKQTIEYDEQWRNLHPFLLRAGEQVLRLAAVYQWFCAPQIQIEKWAVESAIDIVMWHLWEAKAEFGEPPLAVQVQNLAEKLYRYLERRKEIGATCIERSVLLRCAPVECRQADKLNLALDYLVQTRRINVITVGRKEYAVFDVEQLQNRQMPFGARISNGFGNY